MKPSQTCSRFHLISSWKYSSYYLCSQNCILSLLLQQQYTNLDNDELEQGLNHSIQIHNSRFRICCDNYIQLHYNSIRVNYNIIIHSLSIKYFILSTFQVSSEGFNRIQMSFRYLSIWQVIVILFKWPPCDKHILSHRFLYINLVSLNNTYHWNNQNRKYHKHIEYDADRTVKRWCVFHVSTKRRFCHLNSV